VTLKIRNEGSGNASAEEGDPAAAFQATDDRGEEGQELSVNRQLPPVRIRDSAKAVHQGRDIPDLRDLHGGRWRIDRLREVDGKRWRRLL